MQGVCFTGHRNLPASEQLRHELTTTIEMLIAIGAEDFYAGGALGWDTLCAQTVLSLQREYPWIRLHLLLPCPAEVQTASWNPMQKAEFWAILNQANSVTHVSESYHKSCMRKRNAALVKAADCMVCFYHSKNPHSGTGQTVRMAEKKEIRIINLAK